MGGSCRLAGPPIVSFDAAQLGRTGARSGEIVGRYPVPPTGVSVALGVAPGDLLVRIQAEGVSLATLPKPLSLKSSADNGSDSAMIGDGPSAWRQRMFCVLAVVFVCWKRWKVCIVMSVMSVFRRGERGCGGGTAKAPSFGMKVSPVVAGRCSCRGVVSVTKPPKPRLVIAGVWSSAAVFAA